MSHPTRPRGLLRKVDCVQLPVPDLLDLTRGRYLTDADGNVTGVAGADEAAT